MQEEEVCSLKHKNIDSKIEDHEVRIRDLEKNQTEQKIQLMEISKSQIELKSLILETDKKGSERADKTNDKMDKVLDTVLNVFTQNNSNDNEIKFYNTKQFWVIITAIATALITFVTTRGV